jgi:hypothetical protein
MHGAVVPVGGMHSANAREAQCVHSLGSIYSRVLSLLPHGRASCSCRPPASQSKSAVGLAELLFLAGQRGKEFQHERLIIVQYLPAIAVGLVDFRTSPCATG